MDDVAPSPVPTQAVARLYLAGVGGVILLAVGSLWSQIHALVGVKGILPADRLLRDAEAALAARGALPVVLPGVGPIDQAVTWVHRLGVELSWMPTLGWVLPAGWGLDLLCLAAMVAGVLLVVGRFSTWALGVAWVSLVSLSVLGQVFLGYQWDSLLIEVCAWSLLVAPWGRPDTVPRVGWWALRWLLFRLVFFAGLVKLTSGDPTWADLSALTYHYETQPLPNPLSRWVHHLPAWFHTLSAVGMFFIELVLPFALFGPRRARVVAAGGITLLMGALAATGNYGFFQLLTVVLCLTVLDDGHLGRFGRRLAPAFPLAPTRTREVVTWIGAVALVSLSLVVVLPRTVGVQPPAPVARVTEAIAPWRTVNRYGLFARMTTTRPIPILEAYWKDQGWIELTWRHQTSDPGAVPEQVAPMMPRVDWQVWFAGLRGCEGSPWILHLQEQLLLGNDAVARLVGDLRLVTNRPPDALRTVLYEYRFAPWGEETVWTRERLGPFCPEMSLAAPDEP